MEMRSKFWAMSVAQTEPHRISQEDTNRTIDLHPGDLLRAIGDASQSSPRR
jgi:hypothetical protein